MVVEDIKRVPGLYEAWVEPGQSEPVTFNDRIIPEAFTAIFHLRDKSKTWLLMFNVSITEGGTPLLKSVTTHGSKLKDGETDAVQRWQLKVVEQYRYTLLELSLIFKNRFKSQKLNLNSKSNKSSNKSSLGLVVFF